MKCILCSITQPQSLIKIENNIYPDVYLCHNHAQFHVTNSTSDARFLIYNDKILIRDRFSQIEFNRYFDNIDPRFELIFLDEEIITEINSQKFDHQKTYKFILLLAMTDYLIDTKAKSYDIKINTKEILDYYATYILNPKLLNVCFTNLNQQKIIKNRENSTTDLTKFQTMIYNNMVSMPIRRLYKLSFFTSDDYYATHSSIPKTHIRTNDSMATYIKFIIPKQINPDIFLYSIIFGCILKINLINGIEVISNVSKARVGQQQYRNKLITKFKGRCALCNDGFLPLLVASHAKPWSECSTQFERLSDNNGLLLCVTHDKLFDQGYIAIDPTTLLITINKQVPLENYFIPSYLDSKWWHQEMTEFFKYHHKFVFRKN